jgi:hypothetical protein
MLRIARVEIVSCLRKLARIAFGNDSQQRRCRRYGQRAEYELENESAAQAAGERTGKQSHSRNSPMAKRDTARIA